jgi:hypothetical protein
MSDHGRFHDFRQPFDVASRLPNAASLLNFRLLARKFGLCSAYCCIELGDLLARLASDLTDVTAATVASGRHCSKTRCCSRRNVHGSWPNHALALGMQKDATLRDQFYAFVKRYQQYPGKLERVSSAPWHEVVVDKDVNLYDLMPLFRINRGDGGYFIDKPCVISRDPDDWDNDDVENVGAFRCHLGSEIARSPRPCHNRSLPALRHAQKDALFGERVRSLGAKID